MKTLGEFHNEIAEYLLTLKSKKGDCIASISTRNKWEKVFKDIVLVLVRTGHEYPDENDYKEYRASITVSDETFTAYKEKIAGFFCWSKEKTERRHEAMADEKIEVSTENVPVLEAETVEAEHEAESDKNESNVGRKRLDTVKGEKRTEKLMLYLTPSVISDIRDWCSLKNLSSNDYITKLIEADLQDKQDKLNSFRQLRNEA